MFCGRFPLRIIVVDNNAQNRRVVPAEASNISRAQSVRENVLVRGALLP